MKPLYSYLHQMETAHPNVTSVHMELKQEYLNITWCYTREGGNSKYSYTVSEQELERANFDFAEYLIVEANREITYQLNKEA